MKKFSLGVELTKNEQKKVIGGGVVCNDGTNEPTVHCQSGPSYCASRGGMWYCY